VSSTHLGPKTTFLLLSHSCGFVDVGRLWATALKLVTAAPCHVYSNSPSTSIPPFDTSSPPNIASVICGSMDETSLNILRLPTNLSFQFSCLIILLFLTSSTRTEPSCSRSLQNLFHLNLNSKAFLGMFVLHITSTRPNHCNSVFQLR
jgi:hypothetical protein